jgi:hypothetical protein
VRVLSRLFRRLFLTGIERLYATGELSFFGDLAGLSAPNALGWYLAPLRKTEWVVYAKEPFAGPAQVLAYLARYTHRVAIANSRLVELDDGQVGFRWRDYRENGRDKIKIMRLSAGEFMRRFLLHVLPDGFHRIRHYGLFANGHRARKVELCRRLLQAPSAAGLADDRSNIAAAIDPHPCPCCGGRMTIVETFEGPLSRPYHARRLDGL